MLCWPYRCDSQAYRQLIRGYSHGYGFHYKGGSDSHVLVVLRLVFSICLYLQLVANASCISSRRAGNNLKEEIFRVSCNELSTRVAAINNGKSFN